MANIALITNNVLSDSGTALTSVVTGSGTTNYLSKFTGSTALGNSIIYDNGTNVGIGTTSPSYKLDVNGSLYWGNPSGEYMYAGGGGHKFAYSNSTGNYLYSGGSSGLTINNAADTINLVRITDAGLVGIGTTNPTARLHTVGTFEVTKIVSTNTTLYTTYNANSVDVGYIGNGSGTINSGGTNDFGLQATNNLLIATGGGTERMRITASGNVLIGTTTDAGYKLQVAGLQQLKGSDTLLNFGQLDTNNVYFQALNLAGNASKGFIFYGTAEYMRITSAGNVGIGTTSPSEKFAVNGNIALPKTGDTFIYNDQSGSDSITIGGASYFAVKTFNGANYIEVLRATASGNVGIGTTTPGSKLDVNGVIRAGSASSVSGSNILWGNYGNGALTTFGSMYSDGGPVLGYAVSPSTSGSPAFLSSTGITIARGAYAISGATHYWFGGSSQTVAIGSSVSMSEFMRIASTGNLLVGTSTDSGYKLDINGTARINSTLALTSSTYAGTFSFYLSAANTLIGNSSNIGNWLQVGGGNRVYIIGQEFNSTSRGNIFGNTVGGEAISATTIIAQSSGTTDTAGLGLRYTINNTGTYSGVTRGIYYNPTVTSLTGTTHRAIETTTGDVIFNSTSGSVGIGTTSPAYKLQVAGDIGFTAGANRYIRLANPAASGSANHIIIQGASANTSGTGGNIYLYEGSGAGGPGPGSIYIGATTGWTTTYITGQATISSTGPNTGTVFQVNAGGQNGLTINWNNTTPFMGYGLVVNRQSRFYNSSSYTFDNNLIVGSNTNSGEKLQVNGSGNFNLGNSGYIKLQSGSGQRHGFVQSAFSNFLFSNNIYYDGSNWRYDQNGYGAQIQTETLSVGVIAFNTFASGTAGNVATIIESMRIVNNGNILMGTTSDSGHKLQVNGTSKFTDSIYLTGTNRFIASGSSSQSVALYGGSAYTDGAYFNVTGNTYGASPGGGSAEFVIRTNSDSKFAMFGYNGSSWSRYMTLFGPTGNMNIGYGTSDNGYKFTVQGTAFIEGDFRADGVGYFQNAIIQNYFTFNGNAIGGITSYQSSYNLYTFGNGNYSGDTIDGVLATSVSAGQIVFLSTSGLLWDLATASSAVAAATNIVGIACAGGNYGDTVPILLNGFFASNSWYNTSSQYGMPMYLSTAVGQATTTAPSSTGNVVRILGHVMEHGNANGCAVMRFNPDNSWLVI